MKSFRRLVLLESFVIVLILAFAVGAGAQAPPPPPNQGPGVAPQGPSGPGQDRMGPRRGPGPGGGPMDGGPGFMGGRPGLMGGRPGPMEARQGRMGFGMRRQGMGGFGPMRALAQRLGLTEEQRTKLRQQSLESRKAAVRTRADLTIKQMELHELLSADNPDRAQTDRKLREIADLRYAAEKLRVDQRIAFQQLLTPEQRTKLRQFRENGPGPQEQPRRPASPPM